ncbi:hypothetical protein J7384_19150 [Endozoicomonas sp. G2_1]|uniref:hypothetical protein n=1 Tax=Endozoicomonas sp. G2_1 TaxID=2821091 RepID=UPI001AD976B4|nr:hypothetical protein [Endozoicomonas sp. G2_1]MBO9492472.1 hypothetical protein [Endozoicomonas sp. G2_1]
MKYLSIFAFFIIFSPQTLACRYAAKSIQSHYENSSYVFEAVITGEYYPSFEKALINRFKNNADNDEVQLPIMVGETIEFRLLPIKTYKGNEPPKKVFFSGCGSGSADVKNHVLVFVNEYENNWYGYFIRKGDMNYTTAVNTVSKLTH